MSGRHPILVLLGLAVAGLVALAPVVIDPPDVDRLRDWANQTRGDIPVTRAEGLPGQTAGKPVDLGKLLERVEISPRAAREGYDRECGTDQACSFGPAWSDDVDAAYGHNGCDTRNDLLQASLTDVEVRTGTDGCVVESGLLADPYTGRTISFTKERAYEVQVDHVIPLALSWDMGAADWDLQRRTEFANDPRNLIVADGPANASKSDQGPGEWLPINRSYRCTYLSRYLKVADIYDLPITPADATAVRAAEPSCAPKAKSR